MSVHISEDSIVHIKIKNKKRKTWTSLKVQWLRLQTSTARRMGSIPGLETRIPCARQPKKIICFRMRKTKKNVIAMGITKDSDVTL